MKSSKSAPKSSTTEECGVWLDTVQLKGKAKQKQRARPISKLLNPFTGGGGYNLAVALNFTQTKMEMPKTKQSSISNFFTPQRRVLKKMSTSEVQSVNTASHPSTNTPTCSLTSASPDTLLESYGTKRRREVDDHKEPGLYHDWKYECSAEPEAALCEEDPEFLQPSQKVSCELEYQFRGTNSPQSKRKLTETSLNLLQEDSHPPPQAWSQDPLLTCSQFSDDDMNFTYQKRKADKNFETSLFNCPLIEEGFGGLMEGRTSTQKAFYSSQMDNEKENRILSSKSPRKQSTLSHVGSPVSHKLTKPKTVSPKKIYSTHSWISTDKEESSDSLFKWTKPSFSPLKQKTSLQSCRAVDEDSLATMFTQDSEGFRVIAHRAAKARSPLKDQSNTGSGVVRTFTSVEEEDEEDDMLFTQDSQGNVVIKH